MSGYAFTPGFLKDFRALEPDLSEDDRRQLDELLADVAQSPERRARFPAFYDPDHPTWLIRSAPFLIHYSYDSAAGRVVFLNIFRRR